MANRLFWKECITKAWQRRSIIWLSGVRRAGKTYLCQTLPNIEYFDCELPRIRQALEEPESFLKRMKGKYIALDEIHRLTNPSELLKIAADHYPDTHIIATGSSTLGASTKFSDTLTGRKTDLWLTPLLLRELTDFNNHHLDHRFLHGGLPPFLLAPILPERDFQEWIDAYWAKDIQTLFKLEKRSSFQRFTELILAQSGSIFEASAFAAPCEVSRSTISNYLSVLEATYIAHIVRPFNTHKPTEIVSAPKVYGFDTGFVCHNRGWSTLRNEDLGLLWEHCVLNELHGELQTRAINYWRDKQGHEIDFIFLKNRNHDPITIECKWSSKKFDVTNLKSFRRHYPQGKNFVVAPDVNPSFERNYNDLNVAFVNLEQLITELKL